MIDWGRVNELKNEIGEDDFGEIAEIFLEEVDEVIARLKSNPDPSQFEHDMHLLKGSASNLGFQSLSEICDQNERTAASGQGSQIQLDPVFTIYDQSKVEFLAKL
ncbi:HPt (histidine-containing phosphotransfer) domain-containing protein [Aliiroseovarius halocynthiae]|uniref:Hpt domain-containing protein n=1 Tax=Aliiroseovarius halocynthiae TaxID=985055 RepID=A0A545SNY6_9RHOB|nr:Hpt domain-containing protein [Aliiroseovarius halocynthiae]TQV66576.1 Hpt domain-containing protein [Aliiroseovarius halocynthiae]SMR82554.1 HPt (histidine-containing phosphotransfer) domain-containing protein [Aliiroseovarius halocynthiae]